MALSKWTATGRDANGAYFDNKGKRTYFFDAEKTSQKSDDNLCWAASAANMLASSRWGYTASIRNEDQIFEVFRQNFVSLYGGFHLSGLKWYLTGYYDKQYQFDVDQLKSYSSYKGLYPGLDVSKYAMTANATPYAVSTLPNYLQSGGSVGLVVGFYSKSLQLLGGHALTAYSVNVNAKKGASDPTRYQGIYISDPDDDRKVNGGGAKAPDRLVYLPMTWNSKLNVYEISSAYNPGVRTFLSGIVLMNSKPARLDTQSDLKVKAGASTQIAGGGNFTGSEGAGVLQFTAGKDIRLSFAIANDGWNDSSAGYFDILIDGYYFASVTIDALRTGGAQKFKNLNLGRLESGDHRIEIVVSHSGPHDEVTGHNNREVIEITVSPDKTADLTFVDYEPAVVGSESLGASPLTEGEDWGVYFTIGNIGGTKSAGASVQVTVDGVSFGSYSVKSLGKGKSRDYLLTAPEFSGLAAGTHLLELEISGGGDGSPDNNRIARYFHVNSEAIATDQPSSYQEEENGDQPVVLLNSIQAVSITGAFASADDIDQYSFSRQNPDESATIEVAFSGAAGKIFLTDDHGRRELSRGLSSVSVLGDFVISVGDGAASDPGDYFLRVSPLDKQLTGSAPELVFSSDTVTLDAGESIDFYFQLSWDPGREIEFSLNFLYGEAEQIILSADRFRFDSGNWFERQKLTITVKDSSYRDSLGLQFAAAGVAGQDIYLDIADKSNQATPVVTALTEVDGQLEIQWTANLSSLETVEIQRRLAGSDWESVAVLPAEEQSYRIDDFDAAQHYEYRVSGSNGYQVVSPWSPSVEFNGFSPPAAATAPVFFGTPEVAVFGYNAELSWQQAGDRIRVAGYEIRFATTVDGLTGDGFFQTARSYTWKNLAAGDYFVQLRAVNNSGLVSDWTDAYTFTVDYSAPAEAGERLTEATHIALGSTHTENIGGADPADYLQLTLDAGRYSFAGIYDSSKIRVTVFDVFGKKILSSAGRNGTFVSREKLLAAGTYFVEVTVPGRQNAEGRYSLTFDGTVSRSGDLTNQLPGTGTVIDLDIAGAVFSGSYDRGFVGFSDPVDFYQLTLDRVGTLSVSLAELSGRVKLSVGQLDSAGRFKAKKTVTGGAGKGIFGLELLDGDYYIRVESLTAKSDKNDTGYALRLDGTLLDGAADNSNDNWKTAQTLEIGSSLEDWVGRGDSVDYFTFSLEDDGAVKLDFAAPAATPAAAAMSVTLYDARKRRLEFDATGITDILSAGDYFVKVSIDKPKQHDNRYELSIALA